VGKQIITGQIPCGTNEKGLKRCIFSNLFFLLRERERLLDDIHPEPRLNIMAEHSCRCRGHSDEREKDKRKKVLMCYL
jgi:hypothetical protein